MRTPIQRIQTGAVVLVTVIVAATFGYVYLGAYDWPDALYLVVITIASVGFGERSTLSPSLQLYTVGVIVIGMSAAAYTFGGFIQMMTEGEVERALGLRRLSREIRSLRDHVIVCGFGRMGEVLSEQLQRHGISFVIIDRDAEQVKAALEHDYLVLTGDATEEEMLNAAGIDRAKSLITTLPADAENVFITLTARTLNDKLSIISRAEYQSSEKKMIQAGANRVVLPSTIGAHRMATMLSRPTAMELLDLVADRSNLDVDLDEMYLQPGCPFIDDTIGGINARKTHGLLIVAIKKSDGQMVFNPQTDYQLEAGDTLIVMGALSDIDTFRQQCQR